MEELRGKLVAVNPLLTKDPSLKQGQIGIIAAADLKSNSINVAFSSGETGRYSPDDLLVLKDKNELYHDLMTGVKDMDGDTFKKLLDINMKQEHADYSHQSAAIKLAIGSPEVLKRSTVSLQEHLSKSLSNDIGHETALAR